MKQGKVYISKEFITVMEEIQARVQVKEEFSVVGKVLQVLLFVCDMVFASSPEREVHLLKSFA